MKTVTDILNDSVETHDKKNDDYGDSWRKTGHLLHDMADGEPVVLEEPEDWIAVGLFTRRFDKLTRSFQSELLGESMNFEAGVDSDDDEIVYAAMQSANKRSRGDNDH